jgi:hypothetical protein
MPSDPATCLAVTGWGPGQGDTATCTLRPELSDRRAGTGEGSSQDRFLDRRMVEHESVPSMSAREIAPDLGAHRHVESLHELDGLRDGKRGPDVLQRHIALVRCCRGHRSTCGPGGVDRGCGRAADPGSAGGVSDDAGDGDRGADRVDPVDSGAARPGGRVAAGVSAAGPSLAHQLCGREIAQRDLWFPPITLPVGFGQVRKPAQLPVLTIVIGGGIQPHPAADHDDAVGRRGEGSWPPTRPTTTPNCEPGFVAAASACESPARASRPARNSASTERSIAWLFGFRRLTIRYERHANHFSASSPSPPPSPATRNPAKQPHETRSKHGIQPRLNPGEPWRSAVRRC